MTHIADTWFIAKTRHMATPNLKGACLREGNQRQRRVLMATIHAKFQFLFYNQRKGGTSTKIECLPIGRRGEENGRENEDTRKGINKQKINHKLFLLYILVN